MDRFEGTSYAETWADIETLHSSMDRFEVFDEECVNCRTHSFTFQYG